MGMIVIFLVVIFLFVLGYKRTSKLGKIYLEPFAKFLDHPKWGIEFFRGTMSLSGIYKDRKVTCTYRSDRRGASVRLVGYPVRVNVRTPWYRYLYTPIEISGFQVFGNTVVTSERVNYWTAPCLKADPEYRSLLDQLVSACDRVEASVYDLSLGAFENGWDHSTLGETLVVKREFSIRWRKRAKNGLRLAN